MSDTNKKVKVVRRNTWIWPHQDLFVKKVAKKRGIYESELHREILQSYIDNHKE